MKENVNIYLEASQASHTAVSQISARGIKRGTLQVSVVNSSPVAKAQPTCSIMGVSGMVVQKVGDGGDLRRGRWKVPTVQLSSDVGHLIFQFSIICLFKLGVLVLLLRCDVCIS